MKTDNLLIQYDKDLRLRIAYPEARKEITRDVVRLIRKAPGMNVVSFTFANENKLHDVIHREVDYFTPLEQPFTWKVYDHDLLPSLKDQLASHGFAPDEDPAKVMVFDVQDSSSSLFKPVSADIRRINDVDGLKDVVDVLDQVWGGHNTWVYDRLGGHLKIRNYLSVYAAYVNDRPASIAWTYFPRGHFATLFAGSTLPEYRKQGLYTSLLATRIQEIYKRGYQYAVVETGAMSGPIVEKHGFQHLTTVHDFEWKSN
ncbi:MAG TPA: GNAT family N-acetyltransferase [Anaerolineales bacterium]|nr:GNAT family N-acetyltransferase [Anaerolineales bacterium]